MNFQEHQFRHKVVCSKSVHNYNFTYTQYLLDWCKTLLKGQLTINKQVNLINLIQLS